MLKKHNFHLVKDLSLISLERPGANKNLRNFSQQTQISKQSPPYWDTNQIRIEVECLDGAIQNSITTYTETKPATTQK